MIAARTTDPETSKEAAASLSLKSVRSYQLAILQTVSWSGGALSAAEVADARRWTYEENGCYWKRFSECVAAGYLEVTEQHFGERGRWQNAASLTEAGREFLRTHS